mmetsp:Transcript_10149/g.23469  ORF Transcript_10149/g.23469 Transcript_10149/m.23469 type:complete len:88 (+) Transcript_10149:795-1058(+)
MTSRRINHGEERLANPSNAGILGMNPPHSATRQVHCADEWPPVLQTAQNEGGAHTNADGLLLFPLTRHGLVLYVVIIDRFARQLQNR